MKIKILLMTGVIFSFFTCTHYLVNAQKSELSKVYSEKKLKVVISDFFRMDASKINYPKSEIMNAFRTHFSDAVDIEWETRNELFLANFEISKRDYLALYDKKGNLLMYQLDITSSEIPDAVVKAAKERYEDMRIESAEKIVTAYGILFELKMEKGEQKITTYFKADGVFESDRPE